MTVTVSPGEPGGGDIPPIAIVRVMAMVLIRPMALEDIPLLEAHMPRRMSGVHRERWDSQERGAIVCLIAWRDAVPIGHLVICWAGSVDEPVASALPGCPSLEDISVHPDWRSQGIGSRLMAEAERLVTARGYQRVGLGVALANVRAWALYERQGYGDAELGPYRIRWPYLDQYGRERWREETCIYLTKNLLHGG
ncbi:MAG: GNAT family N-acetyltransferase [Chloroflexota bacterium]|nr:GNAT family N-acetyltransferase [Chloroflexota bacterium]